MNIALISGTSGLVGMQLLHQLLQGKEYAYVLSVGRRKLALKHAKLIQIAGDLFKINSWNWQDLVNAQSLGGEYHVLIDAIAEKKLLKSTLFPAWGPHLKPQVPRKISTPLITIW